MAKCIIKTNLFFCDGSFYRGLMVDNKAEDENGYFWSEGYEYKGGIKNNQPHG